MSPPPCVGVCDQWPSAMCTCLNGQGNQVAQETFDALLLEKNNKWKLKDISKKNRFLGEKKSECGDGKQLESSSGQEVEHRVAEIYTSARRGV